MGSPGQIVAQAAVSGYDEGHARKQQRKDMLSDEDRQQKAQDLIEARHNTLANLPSIKGLYGEDSQQYKSALQTITQSQYDLGQLYDPIKNPNAIQQDWHFLLNKLHNIKLPKGLKQPTDSQGPNAEQNTPAASGNPPSQQAGQEGGPSAISPAGTPATPPPAASPVAPAKTNLLSWKDRGRYQSPAELKQKAAAMQLAQQQANRFASGIGLTPQEQAMGDYETSETVQQKKIEDTLATAKKLGFSDEEMTELKRQMLNLKPAAFKPLAGAAGQPQIGPDGKTFVQYGSDANGNVVTRPVAAGFKPNVKAVRGTLINTKSNGWIQTWVDPYNPSKVVGFQKVTPGSRFTGSTSSSSSTDPFGVTTSTSRTTTPTSGSTPVDFDLSGMQQLPNNYDGEDLPQSAGPVASGQAPAAAAPSGSPNKSTAPSATPPASVSRTRVGAPQTKTASTPAALRSQIPSPPQENAQLQVDSQGHIPDEDVQKYGLNANLVPIANNVLDGEDISKIPLKDRGAAENLAKKYGWQGQGLFTPKEKLLLKESATYLDKAIKSSAMKALDSKESRAKMANAIHAADDKSGMLSKAALVEFGLTPQESDFVSTYLQLIGTISGLGQLTRGGRMTEATAKRLMNELPNPLLTQNSKDGIDKLNRLRSEIDVATQKGSFDLNSDANKSGGLTLDEFKKKHNLPN